MAELQPFVEILEEYDNPYSEKVSETAPKTDTEFFDEVITIQKITE